jgi:hypothetical protein
MEKLAALLMFVGSLAVVYIAFFDTTKIYVG